jgi:hypothetical protein
MGNRKSSSEEVFLRLIHERYDDFKHRLSELMRALCMNDSPAKTERAKAALDAATSLEAALATQDRPNWLQPFTFALQHYNPADLNRAFTLIETIGNHRAAVTNHKWAFDVSDDKGFDFDAVFKKYEAESRIPELFDKLVELLEHIVQCKDLDSRMVVQTLESIIATLKKNRNGSFFGVVGTWDFVGTYLKKIAWNAFEKIPVLNVLVKSLRETLDDLNKEMEKVHERIRIELRTQLHADFPVLEYHALPIPEPLALTDETIIDVQSKRESDVGEGTEQR